MKGARGPLAAFAAAVAFVAGAGAARVAGGAGAGAGVATAAPALEAPGSASAEGAAAFAVAPGTRCADARLPRGTKLPADPRCTVLGALGSSTTAAVTWQIADESGVAETGIAVEDLAAARAPLSVVHTFPEIPEPVIVALRDLTKDGLDDVLVRVPFVGDENFAIFGRRADGFGDLGTYRVIEPSWGAGGFTGTFPTSTGDVSARWKFDRYRFVRLADKEARVKKIKATASSSKGAHRPAKAVDGNPKTTWTEGGPDVGLGERLTIVLPRKIRLARVSFALGWDHVSPKLGDLFYLYSKMAGATLTLDDGIDKRIDADPGARWVDYVPRLEYETTHIVIAIDGVRHGSKFADTCISDVEVYERTGVTLTE